MLIFRTAFTVAALAVVVGWPGLSWGQGQRGAEAQKKDQPKSKTGGELQRGMQGGQGGFSFERIAERHDANKDGKITREEWKGPPEYFDRMDRNGDGVITAADFQDGFPGGPGGGQQGTQFGGQGIEPASLFRALDANGDRKVSKEELEKFFNRADSDKDGSLSQEELQAMLRSQSAGNMDRFQQFRSAKPAPGLPKAATDQSVPETKLPQAEQPIDVQRKPTSDDKPAGLKGLTLTRLEDAPTAAGLTVYTFSLERDDGKVEGVLIKPDGKGRFPGVVVNHGGGGNARGFGLSTGIPLAKAGYVVIACNYTHSEMRGKKADSDKPAQKREVSKGAGQPSWWNNAENRRRALASIEILQSLPEVDANQIAMYGNSMGAFLTVVMCQETDQIKAAAITAGGVGAGGIQPSPEAVAKIKTPFLILQGELDKAVRPESAKNLKELLDKQGTVAELKMFPGVGHSLVHERSDEVFNLITAFFARHLGAATASASPPSGADEPTSQSFDRLSTGSTNQPTSPQVRPGFGPRWTGYPQARPAVGEAARDFVLKDLEGNEVRLNDFAGKLPVVIEFGSYT